MISPGLSYPPHSGDRPLGEEGELDPTPRAFKSDAELTKPLLDEKIGPMASESSVSGEVATSEATGAKVLIGVLIGAAVVGGVTAIVLSGGAATPAIIVALEAAGDVTVGTELVDVAMGSTP